MTSVYRAYGLRIESDLHLPELERAEDGGQPDVTIRIGAVSPDGLVGGTPTGPYLWTAPDQLWLHIPEVAHFQISHGATILIAPHPAIDEASLRVFLLGSAFGALLIQRDFLVLHGNAIRIGDACLVCVGDSGAGKSTMAAGLMRRGYPVLADDVVAVDSEGNALPGFPRIKLWQNSADHLGIDTHKLDRIRPEMAKFNLPVSAVRDAVPIRWIYELGHDRPEGIEIVPVSGMQRYLLLHHNSYRRRFITDSALKQNHLRLAGSLANRIHMGQVSSPRDAFDLEALIDHLLADIRIHADAGFDPGTN